MKKIKFFIFLPILVTLVSCSPRLKNETIPVAKNGVLDIRNWDIKKDGAVKLDGEWNFFWKKFIPPEKINDEKKPSKIKVAKVWSSQKINGKNLNRHGYGTYHLKILLNPIDAPLAIKFPTVGCAYEVYINRKKLTSVGKVGKSLENMEPAYLPQVVHFIDQNKELDIVIYVSSFHQKYSGLWYSLYFGQSTDVEKIRDENVKKTVLLFGIFLMMFLYHVGLVILRPKDKLPIYFALVCILLAIRSTSYGEIILLNYFPGISMNWIKTIEYITFYLFHVAISIYIYKLFPDEASKIIFGILNIPMITLTIITIVTQTQFFTHLITIAQGILVLTSIYVFYINILAIIRKRQGSIIFFSGIFAGITLSINDILFALYLTNTGYLATYGLLILIFSQSFLLSAKFSKAFFDVEKLTSTLEIKNLELQDFNLKLEEKVEERTEELMAANEEMRALNENLIETRDELEAANAEAVATNENLIQTRNQLWGEMELAKKIQKVLLPKDPRIDGYEIYGYMQPADEVGGDYYDVINCEGYDWFIIGDVSGHGVPAGLIMMMVQTAIHTAINIHPDYKPSKLLSKINKTISNNLVRMDELKYMTITVFAAYKDGLLHHSGLHQDILIYRAKTDQVEAIETMGFWLGLFNISANNEDLILKIDAGDTILLYTDGITEAWEKSSIKNHRDPKTNMYGIEKLSQTFKENITQHDLKNTVNNILLTLKDYDFDDDITMLLVKKIK